MTVGTPEGALRHFKDRLDHEIDNVMLASRLERGDDLALLDVRAKEDFDKGHVPGALNVPYEEIEERMDEVPKDKELVVYCYHVACMLASRSAVKLAEAGYAPKELVGGWKTWKQKGQAVEKERTAASEARHGVAA